MTVSHMIGSSPHKSQPTKICNTNMYFLKKKKKKERKKLKTL